MKKEDKNLVVEALAQRLKENDNFTIADTSGLNAEDTSVLLLLSRILDDGLSTRVHRTICEERGLAYEAFAGTDLFEDCGVFDFGAAVDHRKVSTLLESMFELMDELRQTMPTEDEVDKAKRRFLWDLRTVRDDTEDTTHFIGTSALFDLPEDLQTSARQTASGTQKKARCSNHQY